jgi:sorbitol/mannitol transport system substrate-binding protein
MTSMKRIALALTGGLAAATAAHADTTLTIATVNNADMIVMQKLSGEFEKVNPGIHVQWVTLEENVLRQRLTTDITTNGGQFDIMTIGLFETPMWGKSNWLMPFSEPPASYDLNDVLPSVRAGLSYDGKLYALPFYAESQMTIYRKDLFDKAGLTMPDQPTWAQIGEFAKKLNDPAHGVYGICLRGKPGWGENMGQITPVVNSYGGRWFDMDWRPQLTTEPWKTGVSMYVDLLRQYGPPGSTSNGYNEVLALFAGGKCAMWDDATVSAGLLSDPKQSTVADKLGYAHAPYGTVDKGNHSLWAWALAVPRSSKSPQAAQKFIYWATSKAYIDLVAKTQGWVTVPPGTRASTYQNPEYLKAAPFAKITLEAIQTADMNDATAQKVPYRGISFVGIPEFQAFGSAAGQQIAAAIAGQKTVDAALEASQALTEQAIREAGYPQ